MTLKNNICNKTVKVSAIQRAEAGAADYVPHVAAYLRVSTEEQDYNNQLQPVLDYCKAHWWPEPEVYAENESAWRQGHQAELARLLRELRTGRRKFDYLVVFALDRLTRGGIRELLQLMHSFELYDCKVVSVNERYLPEEGPMREMLATFIAFGAKLESDRKSQNTLAGLERARANGKKLGRPKGSKDKKKRLKKRPTAFRYGEISVPV